MGPKAIEALIVALKAANPDNRLSAAWALCWLWETSNDRRAIEPLIAALAEHDTAVVAGAYYFFLEQGQEGTQPLLIEALNEFGHRSKEMVEDYLNCGDRQLEAAARQWAHTQWLQYSTRPVRR